jgi:hypothetical protein
MTPCSALSGRIPEEDTLQNHRCENLKSYITYIPVTERWLSKVISCSIKSHAMKTDLAPCILKLDTRWSLTTRQYCSRGKSIRYPLDRRLGVRESLSGRCGEEKNLGSRSQEKFAAKMEPAF